MIRCIPYAAYTVDRSLLCFTAPHSEVVAYFALAGSFCKLVIPSHLLIAPFRMDALLDDLLLSSVADTRCVDSIFSDFSSHLIRAHLQLWPYS